MTLVELIVSLATTTVLVGGLVSAIVLASRAIPDPQSALAATRDGYDVVQQIAGDLFGALSFTERSPTAVEFIVPDRSHGDPGPEVIRYAWSGTLGDPLTGEYNGSEPIVIAPEVYEFSLVYGLETLSETTTAEITAWTEEAPLAIFDGWAGLTATPGSDLLGPGYLSSEYFEITPPDGATALKITRAQVMLSHTGSPPPAVEVAIHRSKGDGSYEPAAAPIGTPGSISGGSIETTPLWQEALFADVEVNDIGRSDYCLVVQVPATPPAQLHYYYSKSAPDNGVYYRWSTDGGASWDPASKDFNNQDMRFYVYGSFAGKSVEEITANRYFLTAVRITLRAGSDSRTRVETAVAVANIPEVASP